MGSRIPEIKFTVNYNHKQNVYFRELCINAKLLQFFLWLHIQLCLQPVVHTDLFLHMARASIRRAMTHRQFKWLSSCSINSYAHINTSKAVNN